MGEGVGDKPILDLPADWCGGDESAAAKAREVVGHVGSTRSCLFCEFRRVHGTVEECEEDVLAERVRECGANSEERFG